VSEHCFWLFGHAVGKPKIMEHLFLPNIFYITTLAFLDIYSAKLSFLALPILEQGDHLTEREE
jgi:hypothetical protein